MQYHFFSINDSKKEKLGVVQANSIEEAYMIASRVKNLPLDEFKKLFKVEQVWRSSLAFQYFFRIFM